jgi:hypothetical protein
MLCAQLLRLGHVWDVDVEPTASSWLPRGRRALEPRAHEYTGGLTYQWLSRRRPSSRPELSEEDSIHITIA